MPIVVVEPFSGTILAVLGRTMLDQHLQNSALEFTKMPNISLAKFSTKQVQYNLCVCLTSGIVSGPSNRKPITFYRIMLVVQQDRVDDKGKTYV